MEKPLSFKDFMLVGMDIYDDEYISYRRWKMKRTNEEIESDTDPVEEALTLQQRMKRARTFKRLAPKIKRGRERAKRRMANKETLEKRARKAARKFILKKLTKGIPKSELSFSRKQEIEKRLDKPNVKKRINMLSRKMLKDVRKKEIERKKG